MKTALSIGLALTISSVRAAPAIIWKNTKNSETLHLNNAKDATDLIIDTIVNSVQHESESEQDSSSSLACAIFLVGRDEGGNEALSQLASTGKLSEVKKRYDNAHSVHYNVDDLESRHTVSRDAKKAITQASPHALVSKDKVMHATLIELEQKLESLSLVEAEALISSTGDVITNSKNQRRRTKALEKASVLIVQVDAASDADIASLDSILASSIDHPKVHSTILAGIRSSEEVKRARKLLGVTQSKRRRLADAGDDDANNNGDAVYYVNMTPNIFAGLLFMFLFTFVAWLGIMCMIEIQGQDVYVTKMPSLGREA